MSNGTTQSRFAISADSIREYRLSEIIRRLLAYFRPYRHTAVFAVLLSLFSTGLLVIRPYLIKLIIDNHITTQNLKGLQPFMLLFIGLYFFRFATVFLMSYLTGIIGQHVMHDLRMDIFNHIMSMEKRFFDRNPVGRLMTRTTDDVATLNELYTSGAVSIFNNATIIIGIVVCMFYLDWKLALITLSVMPLLYVTGHLFAVKIRSAYRDIRKRTARLNAFLQESILGMRIIQLMRRAEWSEWKFDGYSGALRDAKVRNVFYYGMFFPAMELIGTIGLVIILLAGGLRIEESSIQIGVMVAFIRFVDMLFWPVRELAENFNVLLAAIASSERIFTLLDTRSKITNPAKPVVSESTSPSIEFDHVWFAYEGEEWVLHDVSFTVPPGNHVAFVGPSGSGKTTIMSLLMRFYDVNRGRILIDGIDIRQMAIRDLRTKIAYVDQDPYLFNRTIRRNIRLENEAVTDERVTYVLERMNALHFFENLDRGLDTPVRERGSRLSQGQRQLVSFARALAADRGILVLDEATSSVDTFTENLIRDAVPVLMENRTALVIAHRLSTIRTVDCIHVIAKGRICESGTHDELMARDGLYARYRSMYLDRETDEPEK